MKTTVNQVIRQSYLLIYAAQYSLFVFLPLKVLISKTNVCVGPCCLDSVSVISAHFSLNSRTRGKSVKRQPVWSCWELQSEFRTDSMMASPVQLLGVVFQLMYFQNVILQNLDPVFRTTTSYLDAHSVHFNICSWLINSNLWFFVLFVFKFKSITLEMFCSFIMLLWIAWLLLIATRVTDSSSNFQLCLSFSFTSDYKTKRIFDQRKEQHNHLKEFKSRQLD